MNVGFINCLVGIIIVVVVVIVFILNILDGEKVYYVENFKVIFDCFEFIMIDL